MSTGTITITLTFFEDTLISADGSTHTRTVRANHGHEAMAAIREELTELGLSGLSTDGETTLYRNGEPVDGIGGTVTTPAGVEVGMWTFEHTTYSAEHAAMLRDNGHIVPSSKVEGESDDNDAPIYLTVARVDGVDSTGTGHATVVAALHSLINTAAPLRQHVTVTGCNAHGMSGELRDTHGELLGCWQAVHLMDAYRANEGN